MKAFKRISGKWVEVDLEIFKRGQREVWFKSKNQAPFKRVNKEWQNNKESQDY